MEIRGDKGGGSNRLKAFLSLGPCKLAATVMRVDDMPKASKETGVG